MICRFKLLSDSRLAAFLFCYSNKAATTVNENAPIFEVGAGQKIKLLNSRNHCDNGKGKHIFRIDKKRADIVRLFFFFFSRSFILYQFNLFSQGLGDA